MKTGKSTNIPLTNRINTSELLKERGLGEYKLCSYDIGNDDCIHILLAETIPEREQGMFVPTMSNTRYQAVTLTVDWQNDGILDVFVTDFGVLKPNMHFIQRLGDGFLLLCARARLHKDGKAERNALIADTKGSIYAAYCFGDGIQQCIVDSGNRIVTSYFDEGVFGNYGWDQPIGACGLIAWSASGERLWENDKHDICDCYAINVDEHDHLWFYYYTAFNLVRTDYQTETVYQPQISGSSSFLLNLRQQYILFDSGYQKHGTFIVKKLQSGGITGNKPATFTWNKQPLKPTKFLFRCSKAILWDSEDYLYCTDWTLVEG